MISAQPVSFRPVSYSPHTEKQRTAPSISPERPSIPLEQRSTVHFDDENASHEVPKPAILAETKASTGTKIGAHRCNRSVSRSSATELAAAVAAGRPAQSSFEVYDTRELTAVDKKWGRLFEIDNRPTERFNEAMHSLARYIIRAFPSHENIVLVPGKLASFYNFHGVDSDPFCYKLIFQSGDRDLNRRVSDLYQDLGCSYHLVQASPGLQPRIPGLTPDGFTRWMTLHLQAFPDAVSQRLDRVISDFPLDVVSPLDGRTERLPKQLSRYLLPRVPDGRIRSLLQQAIKRHFGESALLAFSLPDEKSCRPAPHTSQSCPTSPALRNFPSPSPSASTPAIFQASHRDGRDVRTPVHVHRASDPGTTSYNTDEKVLPPTHRRHASYPGPQSRSRRGSELVHDRRDHHEHDREREDRRHRSPSRSRSSHHDTRHISPAPSERKEDVRRSHHRQNSLRDGDHHRSESRDSRRRSSSRSSHSGIANSTSNGSGSFSGTTSGGNDGRRSRYPPSPLSTVHPSRSWGTNSPAARDGARSTAATNTSARRVPSPKAHSFRASLPEIHYTDRRRQPTTRESDLAREAKEHSAKANRRASYFGPPAAEDEGRRAKDREYERRMERRASSGEERNYRLYGSSTSSTPIPHYNSTAGARETPAKAQIPAKTKADVPPAPTSSSSPPRVFPTRPAMSLAATVTSWEDERACLKEDDDNGSDQTWEDYLRSSSRVASVT